MRELEERVPEEVFDGELVAFAAFSLSHAACGDDLLELRLGERCLLEWCPSCAAMRMFVSPPGS
jgi:hypothetical protein